MLSNHLGTSMTCTVLLGLLFHLVYIASVFDCYFTSPVVHGMQHFSAGTTEARRLVLIVGDGLRSDLLYNLKPFPSIPNSPEVVAPYLRNIVETRGAFGVSHTRVPTESRPGHVAIIGGMYEDVSAVTRGWKANPVNFDSVFNQSRHTFSFGSPDILPMFAQGAVPDRVKTWCYDEEDEDFTKDATELDVWVLDQLQILLRNASLDASLDSELRGDKVVFFLHLLGLDTTGHAYRPHSNEYMRNIQVVDSIVEQTEQIFRDFFQDEKTSFIFTADHGMSNIGNHGDGDPDSTRTPLIAWGAGVRGPLPDTTLSSHDEYSKPWGLSHLFRRDVEQADIASLMSTLLGLNFPANSVGVLPDIDIHSPGYLNFNEEGSVAAAAVANAKSVLEHYRVKHGLKAGHKVFFKPFPGLATQDKWNDVRKEAAKLIQLSLDGIRYLETYDRGMLRLIVTSGYLGWCAFSGTGILVKSLAVPPSILSRTSAFINVAASCVLLAFFGLFIVQGEPWTYYLYVVFPCYFWRSVVSRIYQLRVADHFKRLGGSSSLKSNSGFVWSKLAWISLSTFASLQAMVLAYKHRSIWSIGFVAIGLLWPFLAWPEGVKKSHPGIVYKWAAACLTCAIFPLRNVEQSEDLRFIILGGFGMISVGLYVMKKLEHRPSQREHRIQLLLTLSAVLVASDSVRRLSAKEGLPLVSQLLGWGILALSVLLPMCFPFRIQPRSSKLLTLFLAFAPCFVLLSICAEGFFYLTYCVTLSVWVEVEASVRNANDKLLHGPNEKSAPGSGPNGKNDEITTGTTLESEYKLRVDDVRIAMFFLFFVQVAFFGTGNVASISSFYLEPVYRLVPIFSPFIMAALLVFKIIAPYVFLSAAFATLSQELHMPPFTLFLIALSLTDGMTISFFLNVTDKGSWLEIGQSISFFVISSLLLLWSAGICALGAWLVRDGKPITGKIKGA